MHPLCNTPPPPPVEYAHADDIDGMTRAYVVFCYLFCQEDLDICLMLRLKFPALFGWLLWFACGRRKCLICGEPETTAGKQYGCNTVGCVYIHCEQCWKDVGVCYACSDAFDKDDNENQNHLDADTTAEVDTEYNYDL